MNKDARAPTSRRYFKELRFQQLRALVEVSRHKSFAAAAAELGLATPSVWQQVRGLEAEFGVEILRVRGKTVELTDEGRFLVDAARPIVEGFDSLHEVFAQHVRSTPLRLVLASTFQLLKFELNQPLAEFRRLHPDVQLSIIDRHSRQAREYLDRGEADVAIVGQLEAETSPAFSVTHLTSYPFVLFAPIGHSLLTSPRVSIRKIASEPLMLPDKATISRLYLERLIRNAGVTDPLNVVMDCSNLELLLEHVSSGFGIALMAVSPLLLRQVNHTELSRRAVGFRDLSSQFGKVMIVMLRRAGQFELPHHRAFQELVEQKLTDERSR